MPMAKNYQQKRRNDIKIRLFKLGKTQRQLAEAMFMSYSAVTFWVNGYNENGIPKHRERHMEAVLRRWESELEQKDSEIK